MRCRSRDRHGYGRHQREWLKRGRNVDGAGVAGASDQLGVVPELLEPVRVTGVDLDPTTAQDRARTQKQVLAIGGAIILAVVVIAALRAGTSGGFHQRVGVAGRVGWSVKWPCDGWVGPASWGRRPVGRRRTCGGTSARGSSCALLTVRRSRCRWDDRPARSSRAPIPASGPTSPEID